MCGSFIPTYFSPNHVQTLQQALFVPELLLHDYFELNNTTAAGKRVMLAESIKNKKPPLLGRF